MLRSAIGLGLLVCVSLVAARSTVPFNDGWSFHREDDARIWRKVVLPHDFAIEDIAPAPQGPAPLDVATGPWRFTLGDDPAWKAPAFDDSGWKTVQVPDTWQGHGDSRENSYGWYRRKVTLPRTGKALLLGLGMIDDADETYLNGTLIGRTGTMLPAYKTAYNKVRKYLVAPNLVKGGGQDVLAIRVYNGQGQAGISSQTKSIVSGPFDSNAQDGLTTGFTVPGIGMYQRELAAPTSWRGKTVRLLFDGVYMNAQVRCNGRLVAERPYGYSPFVADLTPALKLGQKNRITVRVDATPSNSRWYTGAGIYRQVNLEVLEPTRIDDQKQFVQTVQTPSGLAVQTEQGVVGPAAGMNLKAVLKDAAGKVVGQASQTATQKRLRITVPNAKRWSPGSPYLYTLTVSLVKGTRVVDSVSRRVGLRTFAWRPGEGLRLNDKPVLLKGGCVHHDNGPLGAVSLPDAEERKVRIMKSMGYNAIRTAHNPPSTALLNACDKLGMLVLDEVFDAWTQNKGTNYGDFFNQWWEKDVEAWIQRDRSHPSVVAYSIGNEIPEQTNETGLRVGTMLARKIRSMDDTRPVTMASYPVGEGWPGLDPLYANLDIAGYNYMAYVFPAILKAHPTRLIIQTESQSPKMFADLMQMRDLPNVVGDFVWAGWDYLGEVGVGRVIRKGEPDSFFGTWPFVTTGSGEIDMIGNPKPQAFYRKVLFGVPNTIALFTEPDPRDYRVSIWGWWDERASWNWPGLQGKPMQVRVYSTAAAVRLELDGKPLGTKPCNRSTEFTAQWTVPYQPGKLVAVGLDSSGKEICRTELATAGSPSTIQASAPKTLKADNQALAYVDISLMDAKGRLCSKASNLVEFKVSGPATLLGVGNGNPQSVESMQQPRRRPWQGRCLAILRSTGKPGIVTLSASGKGLKTTTVKIVAK